MSVVTMGPPGPADAANFNDAIALAGPNGTVLVPAFTTYIIRRPILLENTTGVTVRGLGPAAKLQLAGSLHPVNDPEGGYLKGRSSTDCTVQGLTILDDRNIYDDVRKGSVYAEAATRFVVRDCQFVGGGHQVCYISCVQSEIRSSKFTGLTSPANCVYASKCTDLLLTDLHAGPFTEYPASFVVPESRTGALRVFQAIGCTNVRVLGGSIRDVDMRAVTRGVGLALSGVSGGIVVGFTASGLFSADGIATELGGVGGVVRSSQVVFANCLSVDNRNPTTEGDIETGDGFDIFNSDDITIAHCTADRNGGTPAHPGIEIFYCNRVSVYRTTARQNNGAGVLVASSPDTTLVDVRATDNGESGCYPHRATNADGSRGGNSTNLVIVGGYYSYNGHRQLPDLWPRQGIYLADATTVNLVGTVAGVRDLNYPPGTNDQQYGLFAANDSTGLGLHLDLRGNANTPGYATDRFPPAQPMQIDFSEGV